MQQWFYTDGADQHGPLAAETIASLYRRGAVHLDTLVWREGLTEWQPLRQLLDELGLAALPPPPAPPPNVPTPSGDSSFAQSRAQPRDSQPAYGSAAASSSQVVQAGFVRRWLALIVDYLVITITLVAVLLVLVSLGLLSLDDEMEPLVELGISGIYLLIAPLYYAGLESSAGQATLGKRLLGIKVVDVQGRRLSFGHALGRWFAATLSYLTFYIGFLMAAFTTRKQALHDIVASTLVVDRWAYTEQPERQKAGLSGCLIAVVLVLLLGVPVIGIMAAIAIPAYHDYTTRAQVSEAISSASPAKLAVAEYWFSERQCPEDWAQLDGGAVPDSIYLGNSEIGAYEVDGECGIVLTFGNRAAPGLHGGQVWLSMDRQGTWTCSGSITSRLLPGSCR